MSRAIELQIPSKIYERAEEIAKESNRSIEKVLLEGLSLLFGSSEQEDISLEELQTYDDEGLWAIARLNLGT